MQRLLNTLYVTTPDAYLAREGETIEVRVDGETRLRLPIHTVGSIVCFSRIGCSPALLGLCGERGVSLAFLTPNGRFLARLHGPVSGNVLLRREQYRRADDPCASALLARSVIAAKVANSRSVLQRGARDRPDDASAEALRMAAAGLARLLRKLDGVSGLDQLRGYEGEAAKTYFSVFDHLIRAQKEAFFFRKRSRRPPLDNMNALLSFLYTLLLHDVASALEAVGLDPAVGYLHRDRPGRPSLALDLLEELRPALADRVALTLVNRQQIKAGGFECSEAGSVMMDEPTRKQVLVAWQERKQETLQHPFLDEKITVGLVPHVQALLLARCLRGDLDAYPAMIWK